jgi:hypothetical protein
MVNFMCIVATGKHDEYNSYASHFIDNLFSIGFWLEVTSLINPP